MGVDLRSTGSTATEDQIGFDPDLVDEPWRIDLVEPAATVEPGLPFTYALRADYTLKAVGPINGVVWAAEADLDDSNGFYLPDEWATFVEAYDPSSSRESSTQRVLG